MMMRVYIAHPLVGDGSAEWGDISRNMTRYLHFCAMASHLGHAVVSWAHHVLLHNAGLTPDDARFYLDRDLRLVEVCHELWFACPVGVSRGADEEREFALARGIPVRADPEWLSPIYLPPTNPLTP